MKLLGLIGGMSWESSALYYQMINHGIQQRLGGLHSATLLMYSVDFATIEAQQTEGRWEDAGATLAAAARSLRQGGAEGIVICTNTMHKVAEAVENAAGAPLLHIADATAEAVRSARLQRIALLGTRFTMEQDFYRGRLAERHGLDVMIPPEEDRQLVHRVIYNELCAGVVRDSSRAAYLEIIRGLQRRGAEGVILGCTEIGMLITERDSPLPVFDTVRIHAEAAIDFMLSGAAHPGSA